MAPIKGGQVSKQQKQSAAAGGGSITRRSHAVAAASRPAVVPAIPLPYMQRHANKQQHHHVQQIPNGSVAVSSNGNPVPSLEAALIEHQAAVTDQDKAHPEHLARMTPSAAGTEADISNVEKPESTATNTDSTNSNASTKDATNTITDREYPQPQVQQQIDTTGIHDLTTGIQHISIAPSSHDNPTASSSVQVSTTPSLVGDVESPAASSSFNDSHQGADHEPTPPSTTESQSAVHSPADPNCSFQAPTNGPSQLQYTATTQPIVGAIPAPFNRQSPQQLRPQFGGFGYSDSHTPSPAAPNGMFMPPPPMNGGGAETPYFPRANGRRRSRGRSQHYQRPDYNGFPTPNATPYRLEMFGMSTTDTYGQIPAPAPNPPTIQYDGYPQVNGRFGPPTPRSYHGSHTSGDHSTQESGVPFTYPNGHSEPTPAAMGQFQPPFVGQPFGSRPTMAMDEFSDSIYYLQNQFNSPEFADCVLELMFPRGQMRINGHKLIFARSPVLKERIRDTIRQQVEEEESMRERGSDRLGAINKRHHITVAAMDPYVRSDAWYTAIQRLYLFPLFTIPPIMTNGANNMDPMSNFDEQFKFCLGYAAAGHYLQLNDVLIRGMQLAASMINWSTIEEGLAFALEGAVRAYVEYGPEQEPVEDVQFHYGSETRILMHAITNFLINAFPPNFELDVSAVDPPVFARIPTVPITPSSYTNKMAPAIARGTSLRKPTKPARLSSIKFGDLPTALPEEDSVPPHEPAKCSPQLSRILLNLPFEDLRYVLTSESNGISGWNTAQDRYHAVADVIAEREARRLRAVEALHEHAIPGSWEIQQRLSSAMPHTNIDAWDVLNWQEEVVQSTRVGVPQVIRKWVPQFAPPREPAIELQPAYESQPRQSMV